MNPQNILLIRTDRMGDLLMTLPAARSIRNRFPHARISLLLQEELKALLTGDPDFNTFLTCGPREGQGTFASLRWAKRLKSQRFDAVVVFNPTRLFHLASFLAGIPFRAGYRRKWGFLLTRSIPDTKASRDLHESEYQMEVASLLTGETNVAPKLRLFPSEVSCAQAQALLKSKGFSGSRRPVAIHPWTSNPAKGWPVDSFFETANRLSGAGRPVVILGGRMEVPLMGAFRGRLGRGVVDLVGQVPLEILPALLKQVGLLISNDSGPVHVAASVQTPTIVVASKSHAPLIARWKPLGAGHRFFISPTPEELLLAVSRCAC
ncbi:MAG: glycosyltransferase family 9 protein [Candidatus Omnitrophica bacterium]|nr:glycosyltransferase family 9 protein [Candidatus Omnitrophota bacterium]